jgi:subtilase family serine protease
MIRRALAATAAITAAAAVSVVGVSATHASASHALSVKPIPASTGHHLNKKAFKSAPTTADCQAAFGINCYSPNQIQKAYDLAPLFGKGITGAGHTIAIVDSFGSPTIASDLKTFDTAFGLPAPPSLKIITPAGAIPAFDPTNSDMTGWAFETSLDVEYAHAMAPGANILLVETPVSETEGVQGFPEIVKAEKYVINNRLADVISQSFGATEETFPSKQSLLNLRSAVKDAQRNGVTVLGASGDDGATDAELDGSTLYNKPVTSWPSSDPLVTSIGGTQLNLDAQGNHVSPDVVWNDGFGAGGGGVSEYFSRPLFQYGVKSVVGKHRGVPDISMSAAVDGGVIVYTSYDAADTGFGIVGGTSEATPIFSGVVALADQVAGHRLGDLNLPLYLMQSMPKSGIVDVTSGNNSFAGVTGFAAKKGYDLASGLGTIDAAVFVPKLAVVASIKG